ncbi:GntR family transcriptional regulator [Pilibacter termitis]|uniref:GntR family transcriptional regulator n=1 Tax=Pilibacter termitis TaxID=263852 RepID=A0A1T4PMB2_9ENTE|nr:GntR family transcriptional regulator [Pilibacter termitis]SJZ92703.1 GntR family transcriptional regulator [Pilibacter termitis]
MSKYLEIAKVLRDRIKSEYYPPDSLLPNQVDLVEEFGASRMTIKKALNILALDGLIYSRRGAGTKILNRSFWDKDTSPADEYGGLTATLAGSNKKIESESIIFEIEFPDEKIQDKLLLNPHQPVYKIIRLRIVDDEPFILEHTYFPAHIVPNLTEDHILSSIYDYIKGDLGLKFAGAFRNVQATKSDEWDQKYLDAKKDDPMLEVEQVIYLKDGRPLEYSRARNRYDKRGYTILDVQQN